MDTTDPNPTQPPLGEPPLQEPPAEPPPQEPAAEPPPQEPAAEPPPMDDPGSGAADREILGGPASQGDPTQRDPQAWVTGDDPATEAQKTYLDNLARAAGEQIPAAGLTKAQASEHIDRLQAQTGQPPRQG